jgi:LPXTG-site transpeptidase (sortase) family protein
MTVRGGGWLERGLLLGGVACLSVFGAATLHSRVGQAYAAWSFDRALEGRPSSATGFLASVAGVSPHALLSSKVDEDTRKDWSAARVRAFEEAEAGAASGRTPLVGRLEIPSLDLAVMVLDGTDESTLNRAVGRIEGTAKPGEIGNLGIAGHRDGWFRALRRISPGEEIVLRTLDGRYRYRIEEIEIVDPADTSVLDAGDEGKARLTLVTCYPFYWVGNAPQRYIVKAELVDAVR